MALVVDRGGAESGSERYQAALQILRTAQRMGVTGAYAVATAGATLTPSSLTTVHSVLASTKSTLRALLYDLRSPEYSRQELVHEDIGIPIEDTDSGEETLSATVIRPNRTERFPTVLLRTPYGKAGFAESAIGLVERGYVAVCVDCRGRFESGGAFFPIQDEAKDAETVIGWIIQQPWYDGHIGVHGESYNGFCAYSALAGKFAGKITCIAPIVSASRIHPAVVSPSGALNWELAIRWLWLVLGRMPNDRTILQAARTFLNFFVLQKSSVLDAAFMHVPAKDIDRLYVGRELEIWQGGLRNPSADSPFWQGRNSLCSLSKVCPAMHIFTGFQDIFLPGALQDYEEARQRGGEVWLTIGDYSHWDVPTWTQQTVPAIVDLYDAKMKGRAVRERPAVCCQLQGTEKWVEMDVFPPMISTHSLYMGDNFCLQEQPMAACPLQYSYDPKDPTPVLGGAGFNPRNCGVVDQALVEARRDVLVFTSAPWPHDALVVGVPSVELYVRSALEHYDVVARLCVVRQDRSFNICDGMSRQGNYDGLVHVAPSADTGGAQQIGIKLGACAFQIRAGDKLRLQVCSGAHPRWMRNYGTGEPIAEATQMLRNLVTLFRDLARPSRLDVPILPDKASTPAYMGR